jgi:glycosyltransferase involved in cell wall biosynthesis
MLSLAEGLTEQGWRVDLVLVNAEGPLKAEIPAACRLIDLRAGQASRALFKLVSYLKTENPGVILASQTHLNLTAVLARRLSRWPGRLLLSEHIALDFAARNPTGWKDRFYPFLSGVFYPGADKVILVSQETARHFLQATGLPEKLVRVIYNPIVSKKMLELARLRPDHAWLANPEGPLLLAAGRLTRQKDFETLLRAFAWLKPSLPSARLIILGEGPEHLPLEHLSQSLGIQNAVQFPGFVANPFAYMAQASVFVLSSRWEGFANVLVEALACGTPVVSTDCPSGPAEILADGRYGLLVPVGHPEALAQAILAELNAPHDRLLLQQRASEFSIERILPRYLEVLTPD